MVKDRIINYLDRCLGRVAVETNRLLETRTSQKNESPLSGTSWAEAEQVPFPHRYLLPLFHELPSFSAVPLRGESTSYTSLFHVFHASRRCLMIIPLNFVPFLFQISHVHINCQFDMMGEILLRSSLAAVVPQTA